MSEESGVLEVKGDGLQPGQIQISAWISRTVQPKQYCPYVVGMSGKMIVEEKEAEQAYDDLVVLLDDRIEKHLEDLGYA